MKGITMFNFTIHFTAYDDYMSVPVYAYVASVAEDLTPEELNRAIRDKLASMQWNEAQYTSIDYWRTN
jgi:hypothetical protein